MLGAEYAHQKLFVKKWQTQDTATIAYLIRIEEVEDGDEVGWELWEQSCFFAAITCLIALGTAFSSSLLAASTVSSFHLHLDLDKLWNIAQFQFQQYQNLI